MNTFGTLLRLTTFGESHSPAIGGVIDGFPAGMQVDFDHLERMMARRRPGQSHLTTSRREEDIPEFLSGINPDGITLGTPIGFVIHNRDARSADYDHLRDVYRPNHADFTTERRYGIRDWRGGGRASARETASWVAAGALAAQWLAQLPRPVAVGAALIQVGDVGYVDPFQWVRRGESAENGEITTDNWLDRRRALDDEMMQEIEFARRDGDALGGYIGCVITGVPAGVGNPVFDKLSARLAQAMMSINAARSVEMGDAPRVCTSRSSEVLDTLTGFDADCTPRYAANHCGGTHGGISNGAPIYFRVGFKPTPTISREVNTVDRDGRPVTLAARGRHDPCVALRAVPVVEAMASLVIMDQLLSSNYEL